MTSVLSAILIVGIFLILLNTLLSKIFFKKQTFIFEKPLYQVPPFAALIPPRVKWALTFKIPRSVKTNESSEVSMEYFQGTVDGQLEALNSFLYEQLELLPKSLPNGLRGFLSISTSKKVKNVLSTDFTAKLTSSRFSIAPIDQITHKKGTNTPCKWRWYISCDNPGKYEVVLELNDAFKDAFKDAKLITPIIFEVGVRASGGWTQKFIQSLQNFFKIGGSVLIFIATALFALPKFQEYVSQLLQPYFPQIFK